MILVCAQPAAISQCRNRSCKLPGLYPEMPCLFKRSCGLNTCWGASGHCHRTASRPRLAAATQAMERANRFHATCAVERAASRGRLAVRALGSFPCCGGSVQMRPTCCSEAKDSHWFVGAEVRDPSATAASLPHALGCPRTHRLAANADVR